MLAVDVHVADDAEVDERDDRDLRVGDLVERRPDRVDRHHFAPGSERRTSVISFQSSASSGVCVAALLSPATASSPTRRASSGRRSGVEHAERVRPQLLDRRAEAWLVAQAAGPHLGVQAVVDLLAVDLRREPCELRVVGCFSASMRTRSASS